MSYDYVDVSNDYGRWAALIGLLVTGDRWQVLG